MLFSASLSLWRVFSKSSVITPSPWMFTFYGAWNVPVPRLTNSENQATSPTILKSTEKKNGWENSLQNYFQS